MISRQKAASAGQLQRHLAAGAGGLRQPIVLTKADGTVFVTADGKALVRGYRTVSS